VLSPDHFKLLRNAVDWTANEPLPVSVEGPGIFDVTIWRQQRCLTVHLVNLTNPMMMKGPAVNSFACRRSASRFPYRPGNERAR
jgi:hypothetical protein